ncbi:hypothetical protein NPIL_252361, partial [Nephila pilipes]
CDCGKGANCTFEPDGWISSKKTCICPKDYREVNKKCVASCKSNSDCKNGGTCGKDQVCECKEGSSGDRCEIIKGCEKLACDPQISNCVLDLKAKNGICECKEKTKLYVNHKCLDEYCWYLNDVEEMLKAKNNFRRGKLGILMEISFQLYEGHQYPRVTFRNIHRLFSLDYELHQGPGVYMIRYWKQMEIETLKARARITFDLKPIIFPRYIKEGMAKMKRGTGCLKIFTKLMPSSATDFKR